MAAQDQTLVEVVRTGEKTLAVLERIADSLEELVELVEAGASLSDATESEDAAPAPNGAPAQPAVAGPLDNLLNMFNGLIPGNAGAAKAVVKKMATQDAPKAPLEAA